MLDQKKIAAEIQRMGFTLDEAEALSLKYKTYFEVLERDTRKQLDLFMKDIRQKIGEPVTEARFQEGVELLWSDLEKVKPTVPHGGWITRQIFDAFMRAAEKQLFPGIKEGHYRIPTMKDMLDGKSSDPFQDLMMLLFTETSRRKKERNEQSDR